MSVCVWVLKLRHKYTNSTFTLTRANLSLSNFPKPNNLRRAFVGPLSPEILFLVPLFYEIHSQFITIKIKQVALSSSSLRHCRFLVAAASSNSPFFPVYWLLVGHWFGLQHRDNTEMYIIIISSSNNNNSVAELPTHTRTHCGDKHGYTHSLSQADIFLCIADNSKALNLRLNFQNAYTHISSSHISYTYVHTYIYFLFMYIQMCVCMALCIFKRVHTEKIHQKLYYWLADWLTACFKGLFFFCKSTHSHTHNRWDKQNACHSDGQTYSIMPIQLTKLSTDVRLSASLYVRLTFWRLTSRPVTVSASFSAHSVFTARVAWCTNTHTQNSEQKYGMRKETEKQQIFHSFSINIPCKYACWRWWRNHVNV